MKVRIPVNQDEQYTNIIQLLGLMLATEFLVSMEYLSIYKKDDKSWSYRRVFWYIMAAIPCLFLFTMVSLASLKILCL